MVTTVSAGQETVLERPLESAAPERREELTELDYFGALSCLFVVIAQVLSGVLNGYPSGTWQYAAVLVVYQFSACAVPALLFCDAVRMAIALPSGPRYLTYVLRRLCAVYLPYLVWNVIYYLAFMPLEYVLGSFSDFMRYILNGSIAGQLYYIPVVMQFYLLLPLWRWVVKRVPWYVGLPVALFLNLVLMRGDSVLSVFGRSFPYFDRLFFSYLIYWTTGLYVGKYYRQAREVLAERRAVLGFAVIPVLYISFAYIYSTKLVQIYDFSILKLFSDLASAALVLKLCLRVHRSGRARIKALLSRIYDYSFTVFLSNALFSTLTTAFLWAFSVTDTSLQLLSRTAVSFTVPFLLAQILTGVRSLLLPLLRRKTPRT